MDGGGGFLAAITRWLTPPIFFCLLNLMVITIFIRSSFKPKQNNKQEHHTQPPLMTQENNPVHFFRFPSLLNRVKSFNFSRSNVDEPAERYQHAEPEYEHAERYQHAEPENNPVHFFRLPSLLNRVKSFKFSRSNVNEPAERYQHAKPEYKPAERYQHAEPKYKLAERYLHAEQEDEHAERYQHAGPEYEHAERYQHAEPEHEPVEEEKEPEEGRHVARTMSDTMEVVVKRKVVRGGVKMMRKSQSLKIVRVVEEEEEVEAVERERPATVRESRKTNETVPFDEDEAKADDFINRFKQQLKLQRLESFLNYRGASK